MTPDPKPKRDAAVAMVNRFLKPTPKWDAAKEMPTMYRLFAQYPSTAFWTHYEVGFPLNSLFYFLTPEGKERLASDWVVFHFRFPDAKLDTGSELGYTAETPAPVLPPRRARSAAEFLSSHHGQTH